MTTDRKVQVPPGKVLVTSGSDWFTNEVFWSTHDSGSSVSEASLKNGRLLKDGAGVEVRESVRNDGPGEKRDHMFTTLQITNKAGKAVVVKLREWTA